MLDETETFTMLTSTIHLHSNDSVEDHSKTIHRRPFSIRSGEITPPLTPALSRENLTEQDQSTLTPLPTYLRATYPFHPACDFESDTVTLPLNQGDIVLIHSIHSNGWADGTLLDTAHRGWLPTNYCEAFDAEPVRKLLNALTTFWDSASDSGDSTVAIVHGHNLTQGLVAGVRYLLSATNCLNREVPLLSKTTGHVALRRHRKTLLSDLSDLVKFFKICEPIINANEPSFIEDDLSQVILKTFKIIIRAVKFYDVYGEIDQSRVCSPHNIPVPPTPPSETCSFSFEHDIPQFSSSTGVIHEETQPHESTNRNSILRYSTQSHQGLYHRMSWSNKHADQRNARLASSRLILAHESFLSFLAAFLSTHLATQSSTELLIATQQAVNAGRALLTVIEAVWDRGHCKSRSLESARDDMYTKITQLILAAQQIFSASDSELASRNDLTDAALSCIKAATECVDETRTTLELIGDFEFETIQDTTSFGDEFEFDEFGKLQDSADLTMVQDFPLPPDHKPHTTAIEDQVTPIVEHVANLETRTLFNENGTITPSSRLSMTSIIPSPPSMTDASSVGDISPLSISSEHVPVYPPRKQSIDATKRSKSNTRLTECWLTSTLNHSESSASLAASLDRFTLDGDAEEDIMQTTYAHELVFNKDGQISGGTLPALVERLTTSESRPDHVFLSSFFLTFRMFTTAEHFASALVQRYHYIGDYKSSASIVRLRVFNVLKIWLETNWRKEVDFPALPIIETFAREDLISTYPTASTRLLELAQNLSGVPVLRQLKSKASVEQMAKSALPLDTSLPNSTMNKHQMVLLKSWQQGASKPQITDFDTLEVARQLTLKASSLFCSIQPEELLATEWTKKNGSSAVNVRAMSTLSTDLANFVADSILQHDDHSRRAKVIKHWIKIATKCLELNNYDSLMAIVCSIHSTPVLRLKKTWDCVSSKSKAAFDQLKPLVDCSKNYTNLRQRLASLVSPALPFLGVYLTDLMFVEAGNACTRDLPRSTSSSNLTAINFDKHAKTARIIFELQRFQTPYHLQEIPELQTWLQDQFIQVRCSLDTGSDHITKLYRRSCILEPRLANPVRSKTPTARGQRSQIDLISTYFS